MATDVQTFDIGDVVRLEASFKNAANVATTPTTTVLTLKMPDGTLSTPAITANGTGVYYYDVLFSASGAWTYRWVATGTVQTAEEGRVYVRPSKVLA